jgi:putative hydrolase of the HAD superfamily
VSIPNPHTWVLEHDELDPTDSAVLHLERFRELTEHF